MTEATEILFVRHGQTHWNTERRMQGHQDSPLTDRGRRGAEALAAHLEGSTWHALVSSDLGRAVQTAEILSAGIGLPVVTDPRLRERNAGFLEGLTVVEAEQRFPGERHRFRLGDPEEAVGGAESYRAQYERTVDCVEALSRSHAERRVLVVTHGGNLSCVMRHALGLPLSTPRRWSLPNCGTNLFSVQDGDWQLVHWGRVVPLTKCC